ncbi:MAG: LysR substrate-binding domain-containing protein [Rhodospirillaceae bacterium]
MAAERALVDHSSDLAVLAEPPHLADFEVLLTIRQPLYGIVAKDHPLAGAETLRIGACFEYPLAVPEQPNTLRLMLEAMAAQRGMAIEPVVQSDSYEFLLNYGWSEPVVSFYLPIGLPDGGVLDRRVARPIDARDARPLMLYLGKLRNRHLPVAAARFADQLTGALMAAHDSD